MKYNVHCQWNPFWIIHQWSNSVWSLKKNSKETNYYSILQSLIQNNGNFQCNRHPNVILTAIYKLWKKWFYSWQISKHPCAILPTRFLTNTLLKMYNSAFKLIHWMIWEESSLLVFRVAFPLRGMDLLIEPFGCNWGTGKVCKFNTHNMR